MSEVPRKRTAAEADDHAHKLIEEITGTISAVPDREHRLTDAELDTLLPSDGFEVTTRSVAVTGKPLKDNQIDK